MTKQQILKAIGREITEGIERAELPRTRIANKIGKTPESVWLYEQGKAEPGGVTLLRIVKVLDLPFKKLIKIAFGSDPQKKGGTD